MSRVGPSLPELLVAVASSIGFAQLSSCVGPLGTRRGIMAQLASTYRDNPHMHWPWLHIPKLY